MIANYLDMGATSDAETLRYVEPMGMIVESDLAGNSAASQILIGLSKSLF
jgi:hypothetical protein